MKVTNMEIASGGLSNHCQIGVTLLFCSLAFSTVWPTKPDSLDTPLVMKSSVF